MDDIKRNLVESGVIGRVLHDFNPRLLLILFYGQRRIISGDQVTPAEVQRQPTFLHHIFFDRELEETFNQPKPVVLVMTDPDAPGGEYLHWIAAYDVSSRAVDGFPWIDMVAYQPPRPGARMLVFTFFQATDRFCGQRFTIFQINSALRAMDDFQPVYLPIRRENFSTINFVETNAVGSVPLGAVFFNINYDTDDKNQKNDNCESSACSNAV